MWRGIPHLRILDGNSCRLLQALPIVQLLDLLVFVPHPPVELDVRGTFPGVSTAVKSAWIPLIPVQWDARS